MNLASLPSSSYARSCRPSCLDLLRHTWRGTNTLKTAHYGIIFLLILFFPTSPRLFFLSIAYLYSCYLCRLLNTRDWILHRDNKNSQMQSLYINLCFTLFFPFFIFLVCSRFFLSCLEGAKLSTCRRDLWSKKAGEPSDKRGSKRWKGEIKSNDANIQWSRKFWKVMQAIRKSRGIIKWRYPSGPTLLYKEEIREIMETPVGMKERRREWMREWVRRKVRSL